MNEIDKKRFEHLTMEEIELSEEFKNVCSG